MTTQVKPGLSRICSDLKVVLCTCSGLKRAGVLLWASSACIISYSVYAFVVYLADFRDAFHMNQAQANFSMSLVWLGMGSPIVLGIFIKRCGARWGSLVAMVLSVGPYLLLYSACRNAEWYRTSHRVYLVYLYCFLIGTGSGATSIAGISAAIHNFSDTYRGIIMMCVTSGTAAGGTLFKLMYQYWFEGLDENEANLGGYFFCVACFFLVYNIGGILFYGRYYYFDEVTDLNETSHLLENHDEDHLKQYDTLECTPGPDVISNENQATETADLELLQVSTNTNVSLECQYHKANLQLTLVETLRHPIFHMLAWPCIISQGSYFMTVNNVVIFLESFNQMQWATSMPYISDIVQMVCRPLVTISSDLLQSKVSRAWFILLGCVLQLIFYTLDTVLLDKVWLLCLNMLILAYSFVATFTMTPALLCDEFGIDAFPRNWGIVQGSNCVSMFLFCNLISLFYTYYRVDGNVVCSTVSCYTWTYNVYYKFPHPCLLKSSLEINMFEQF